MGPQATETGPARNTDDHVSVPFVLRLPVLIVFFSSGMVALVYQITWTRMFYPVFGMHLPAISAVVATFMGGLGFGALLFGRLESLSFEAAERADAHDGGWSVENLDAERVRTTY